MTEISYADRYQSASYLNSHPLAAYGCAQWMQSDQYQLECQPIQIKIITMWTRRLGSI